MIFPLVLALFTDRTADPSTSTTPAPRTIQPSIVAFRDKDLEENCSPLLAQSGDCVEYVEFRIPTTPGTLDNSPPCAWLALPGSEDQDSLTGLRDACIADTLGAERWLTAWSTERLLEDLIYRWSSPELETSSGKAEQRTIGPLEEQWKESKPIQGSRTSVVAPADSRWIIPTQQARWPGAEPVIFAPLAERMTPMTRFGGRFADAPYASMQSMPGDIFASEGGAAFFEQLCPYRPGFAGRTQRPWSGLDACRNDLLGAKLGADEEEGLDGAAFAAAARARFELWAIHLGGDLLQFGSVDPTLTHIRTFSALAMMSHPPRAASDDGRMLGHPNPGSWGQPDSSAAPTTEDAQVAQVIRVNSRKLAEEALSESSAFLSWMPRSGEDDLRPALVCAARQQNANNGPPVEILDGLDAQSMRQWANTTKKLEQLTSVLSLAFDLWQRGEPSAAGCPSAASVATSQVVSSDSDSRRKQQLRWALAMSRAGRELVALPAQSSPAQVLERTTNVWIGSQEDSNISARLSEIGPGQVDPLAVCGLRKGAEAQSEPSVQRVTLDVLFEAPETVVSWSSGVEPYVWAARRRLPFVALDRGQAPTTTRLWGLPNGRAVFRARWVLWSGWHVLWGLPNEKDSTDEPASNAMVTQFSAVCEDMVLIPDDLVPTVVYASLLADTRRGTLPVSKENARIARRATRDGEDPQAPKPVESLDIPAIVLRSPSLFESDLLVLDLTPTQRRVSTRWGRPHSPYLIQSRRVGQEAVRLWRRELRHSDGLKGERGLPKGWRRQLREAYKDEQRPPRNMRMSAWLVHLDLEGQPVQLLPLRRPGARVDTSAPRPVWRRVPLGAWDLMLTPGGYGEGGHSGDVGPSWSAEPPVSDSEIDAQASDVRVSNDPWDYQNLGVALNASLMRTLWLQEERVALQGQLVGGVRLDQSVWSSARTGPWGQVSVGVRAGVRVIVPPQLTVTPRLSEGLRHPWGVTRPDGTVHNRRMEWIFSTGYSREMLTSDIDGGLFPRHVFPLETSLAWSAESRESTNPYLPYRPAVLVGPTLSLAYGLQQCEGVPNLGSISGEPHCQSDVLQVQAGIGVHIGLRAMPELPELR